MRSIVIDTNVVIAGLGSGRGASFKLLELLGRKAFSVNVSVPLVLEYEATAKEQARGLGLTHAEIDGVVDYICSVSNHREIYYLWRPFLRDPKDDLVLELAVESEADYIVTHNLKDFAEVGRFGLEAITPAEFLERHNLLGTRP